MGHVNRMECWKNRHTALVYLISGPVCETSTFECHKDMTVSAVSAISWTRPACVAEVSNKSWADLFLPFTVREWTSTLRNSNLKQKKYFYCINIDKTTKRSLRREILAQLLVFRPTCILAWGPLYLRGYGLLTGEPETGDITYLLGITLIHIMPHHLTAKPGLVFFWFTKRLTCLLIHYFFFSFIAVLNVVFVYVCLPSKD